MKFNYNNYMLEENRIIDVINDIKNSYPKIPANYLRIIASLESNISTYEYSPLMEFTRLYNILFILDGDESLIETYLEIKKRIKKVYINIINLKVNYKDMKRVNSIMQELIKYFNGSRVIFPSLNECFNI